MLFPGPCCRCLVVVLYIHVLHSSRGIIASLEAHSPPSHRPDRSRFEQPSPPGDQARPRTSPSQTALAVCPVRRWRFRTPVPPLPNGTETHARSNVIIVRSQGTGLGSRRTEAAYLHAVSISGRRPMFNRGGQDLPPAAS